MVTIFALIPGMPFWPFITMAAIIGFIYIRIKDNDRETAEIAAREEAEQEEAQQEEKVEDLIASDRIGVEIGYRLIPLVDKERGGTFLNA